MDARQGVRRDLAELPDLGASFTTATAWRHELTRLRRS